MLSEQKLLVYFLNWFISKPIDGIISVLGFDLLGKVRRAYMTWGLILSLHPLQYHQTKPPFNGFRGFFDNSVTFFNAFRSLVKIYKRKRQREF